MYVLNIVMVLTVHYIVLLSTLVEAIHGTLK